MASHNCPLVTNNKEQVARYLRSLPVNELNHIVQNVQSSLSPSEKIRYDIRRFCSSHIDTEGRIRFILTLVNDGIILPLAVPASYERHPKLAELMRPRKIDYFRPAAVEQEAPATAALTDELADSAGEEKKKISICNPRWEPVEEAEEGGDPEVPLMGDTVRLLVDVKDYPDGAPVSFDIYDMTDSTPLRITTVNGKNDGGTACVEWEIEDPQQRGENLKLQFEAGASSKYTKKADLPWQAKFQCDFIEIPDVMFHLNSAVPILDTEGVLPGAVATAFLFAKENSEKELVIFGYSDTSGDPAFNYDLSVWRAEAIKALCDNDTELWLDIIDLASKVEDYQEILSTMTTAYGWNCDPGTVDNQNGPKTKDAVKAFQAEYNNRYEGTLTVDGVIGPKTWTALFTVLHEQIVTTIKNLSGEETIPSLIYGYDGKGIYGCGESFPIDAADKDNYVSAENRRVEMAFFEKGKAPPLTEPEDKKEVKPKEAVVNDKKKTDKVPVKSRGVKPTPVENDDESLIFYAPGRNEYFEVEPADIDALRVEVDELEKLSQEIIAFRESCAGKKMDKSTVEKGEALQKKVAQKFDGIAKEPQKAIQELLLVKSSKRAGKMKSRIYIRPYKVNERQVRGHWRKHTDATIKKKLQEWLKNTETKKPDEKKKIEKKLKATLFQTDKIDTQWPWDWKFQKKGETDTAVGYFSGEYDVQFFRFVAGAKAEAEFDLDEKKLTLGADAGVSYSLVDGTVKGRWGLPDQDGFSLYEYLLLSPNAREAFKPNYDCRFRFDIAVEGKVFVGASIAAVVALPSIDLGKEKKAEAGGSLGAFAGASAGGKIASEVAWSKAKTAKFDTLAAVGAAGAVSAGAGIEGKFVFKYENGKVIFETGVMVTLGLGGKGGLSFELGVDKAVELFSHMFRSVDWHKVDSVTLLAFEFYVNVAFAQFIAAGKVTDYLFDKAGDVAGWISNKISGGDALKESKKNIRVNINDTKALQDAPPEALGRLLNTIMKTKEEGDYDAIIKVLNGAESEHELKWMLRHAQEKVKIENNSSDAIKGKALQEGIRNLMEFGGYSNEDDRNVKYLKNVQRILQSNNITHGYNEEL